jgi:hypothetical protein
MSDIIAGSIEIWRQKSLDGTITIDQMRQAIAAIRAERVKASEKSAVSRERKATTKAKAAPVDSEALLGELFGEDGL